MQKDDKMDEGAAVSEDHDLPDDLYEETEGVELRMSSPGPPEQSPVHVDNLEIELDGDKSALCHADVTSFYKS